MEIFVSQLPETVKEYQLKMIFEKYGTVNSCKLVFDHITRKSKGFGFVQMPNADQAKHAIDELDGAEVDDNPISVRFAKPKESMQKSGGKATPTKTKPAFEKPKYAAKDKTQKFSKKASTKKSPDKEPKPLSVPKRLKRPE